MCILKHKRTLRSAKLLVQSINIPVGSSENTFLTFSPDYKQINSATLFTVCFYFDSSTFLFPCASSPLRRAPQRHPSPTPVACRTSRQSASAEEAAGFGQLRPPTSASVHAHLFPRFTPTESGRSRKYDMRRVQLWSAARHVATEPASRCQSPAFVHPQRSAARTA